MTKYRCPTLGGCERADAGEVFERNLGEDIHCPECGTPLEEHPLYKGGSKDGAGNRRFFLGGALLLVLLIAGGGVVFIRSGTVVAPSPGLARSVAAPEPTSAPAGGDTVPSALADTGKPAPIEPSATELASQKVQSQLALSTGNGQKAEAESTRAAANEMIKLGIAQLVQGKLDTAEQSFLSALRIDPKASLAYYNLAIVRLHQSRTDDAILQFESAFVNGFQRFDLLASDPDLGPIRKDKRFVDLVARYAPSN